MQPGAPQPVPARSGPSSNPPARPVAPRGSLAVAVGGWVAATVASGVFLVLFQAVTGMPEEGESVADLPLWAVTVVQLPHWLALVAAVAYASRTRGTGRLGDDVGARARWPDLPAGLAAGVAAYVVIVTALAVAYDALGVDDDRVGGLARSLAERAEGWSVVFFLVITLVGAPLVEELFYRGLVLRGLERHLRPGWALVASAVVFGLVHFRLLELPALVAFGLVLGWLAQRTGRLAPAVAAHVGFNATAVAIALLT